MATSAVQNPQSSSSESKSARKKKVKADATASNGATIALPITPNAVAKEDSSLDAKDGGENGVTEHPYIRELNKHLRNVHKKITGMQKTETIVAENPGVSLDQLVKDKKINADQKNSVLKKPQLESQLASLEEQVAQYKKFEADFQVQLQRQKEELTAQHAKDLDKARADAGSLHHTTSAAELRSKLLIFSQFLRCAAAKRMVEEDAHLEENQAFEGALLLVYGGDDKAVQAALDLIDGKEEKVSSVNGTPTDVTCRSHCPYSHSFVSIMCYVSLLKDTSLLTMSLVAQVKSISLAHAPFQIEESWVDSVAEANATGSSAAVGTDPSMPSGTDPTVAYAGLTEIDTNTNGVHGTGGEDPLTSAPQADAGDVVGNAAGDKWDPSATTAEKGLMEDDYEMVPRPQDELETPAPAGSAPQEGKMSWADDQPAQPPLAAPSGNVAGESWESKPAGAAADDAWNGAEVAAQGGAQGSLDSDSAAKAVPAGEDSDGFHQVGGRHRGRGRGRGGDGEFRGRGGFRGRGERGAFRGEGGEFRGRGRGGFRGRGEGGEFRGRGGGRGRGGRGAAAVEGQPRGS